MPRTNRRFSTFATNLRRAKIEPTGLMARSPKEKFIGFVDILGYSALTKAAEASDRLSFDDLAELVRMLGTKEDMDRVHELGPSWCPDAPRIRNDVDFQIAQAWDSVVVSAEISPGGLMAVVGHCSTACVQLLSKGVMCRGYIKKGMIYHEGMEVFGSGHVEVVLKEKVVSFFKEDAAERGTPFIEVDKEIVGYVTEQQDKCVKEMFGRMVMTQDGLTALFPIQRLTHSFSIVGGFFGEKFDSTREKAANENIRNLLRNLKAKVMQFVDPADVDAARKAEHYVRALDRQLFVCDKVDQNIDRLCQPSGISATRDVAPGLFLKD